MDRLDYRIARLGYDRKSVPEPPSMQYELFFPIDPKYIRTLLQILKWKYLLSATIFIVSIFVEIGITINEFVYGYGLTFTFDGVLLLLLMKSSNQYNDKDNLSKWQLRLLNIVVIMFFISLVLFLISPDPMNITLSLPFVNPRFSFNILHAQQFLWGILLSEILFFVLIKEKLIKSTDKNQVIYLLSGLSLTVLLGFFFIFLLSFLLTLLTEPWEFHTVLFVIILTYLVFVDLWISGPNEYMDKEGMYRLSDLTGFMGIFLLLNALIELETSNYSNAETMYLLMLPLLLFNLFGKYHGYIFRVRKLVQSATMHVDDEINLTNNQ